MGHFSHDPIHRIKFKSIVVKERIIAIGFALLAFWGCDDGFEELNVNPNLPTTTDPDFLFANAQHKFFTHYEHGVFTEVWGLNIWMQQMADINGISAAGNEYLLPGDALNITWRMHYAEVMSNIQEAIRLVEDDPGQGNRLAIYRIFQAYVFQRTTDLWGAVPFSEALKASSTGTNPDFTPAYDTQEAIYIGLFAQLKAAEALLDPTAATLQEEDWLYQGDPVRWRKFSRTLRLRMALRLSEVDPVLAQEEADAVLGLQDFISSHTEGAHFPHSDVARSPFYQLDFTGQGMRHPSQFLVDLCKATQDPRLPVYAEPSPESIIILGQPDYVGVPNFLVSSAIDPDELNDFTVSAIGPYFLNIDRPGTTLGYAESCFLQAEAALRGWGGGDAAQWHDAGVRAHMTLLGIPETPIEDYLTGPGQFDQTLEKIITEKWKTFVYVDAIEAYNEYRRTGIPQLLNPDGSPVNAAAVPKRFAYPNSEISLNGSNVSALGIDPLDTSTPVWWDAN